MTYQRWQADRDQRLRAAEKQLERAIKTCIDADLRMVEVTALIRSIEAETYDEACADRRFDEAKDRRAEERGLKIATEIDSRRSPLPRHGVEL